MGIIKIGNKEIKNFGEPFIVAEIGSNHNGQLDLAKQLIDKAVECGADAVKFQAFDTTLFSEACYETDYRRQQLIDESPALKRFFTIVHPDLKRQMQEYMASRELLREMKKYCDEKQIMFCCTPLDKGAVDFLVEELNIDFIKVASMDANNYPFLEYIARKGKPIVLSTGMASFTEIIEAVGTITKAGNEELILLHCVSTYPPKDENINLNNLDFLRQNFDYPVGWSDHTLGWTVPLAAVAKGACLIEKHFTLDKNLPGWDHKVSATPEELKLMVEESKKIWRALGSHKRVLPQEELDKRHLFRRSIVVKKNMKAGEIIKEEDIDFKRPGIGIEPKDVRFIIGRTLKGDLKADDLIRKEDLV
ncbi:MAG: N-acetylneuraminate synthase family protein [Nanoarchaeota archaeon]